MTDEENGSKSVDSLECPDQPVAQSKNDDTKSQFSEESKRYSTLKKRKKSAKTRLTKAKNQIATLTTGRPSSKTEIRRVIKTIRGECDIIEKIIHAMKELAAISVNEFDGADADTIIENLDNELAEILKCADVSVKAAQDHVNERLLNGEDESRASTILSSELSIKSNDVKSVIANSSKKNSNSEKQQDVEAANERLRLLEEEQCELEEDLQRKANACDINRQRIEDARSIVLLNEARLKENETQEKTNSLHKQELPSSKICQADTPHKLPKDLSSPSQTTVKLKGVQLPTFSGEDKSEFEAWKAAFTSVVDDSVMPVKEKMLRLLGC